MGKKEKQKHFELICLLRSFVGITHVHKYILRTFPINRFGLKLFYTRVKKRKKKKGVKKKYTKNEKIGWRGFFKKKGKKRVC